MEDLTDVFLLAATSRPWVIDPAVLRPGRIDVQLFLDYPDLGERVEILKIAAGGGGEVEGFDPIDLAKRMEGTILKISLIKIFKGTVQRTLLAS